MHTLGFATECFFKKFFSAKYRIMIWAELEHTRWSSSDGSTVFLSARIITHLVASTDALKRFEKTRGLPSRMSTREPNGACFRYSLS